MVKTPAKKPIVKKAVVKAKGKKPALKKILIKSPLPWEDDWEDEMDSDGLLDKFLGPRTLWEITNDIERNLNRISNAKDVVEMAAERITVMPESGALWAVADMLREIESSLDKLTHEILSHNKSKVTVTP